MILSFKLQSKQKNQTIFLFFSSSSVFWIAMTVAFVFLKWYLNSIHQFFTVIHSVENGRTYYQRCRRTPTGGYYQWSSQETEGGFVSGFSSYYQYSRKLWVTSCIRRRTETTNSTFCCKYLQNLRKGTLNFLILLSLDESSSYSWRNDILTV